MLEFFCAARAHEYQHAETVHDPQSYRFLGTEESGFAIECTSVRCSRMVVAAESRCGTGRIGSDPIRRYSILARPLHRRDVAFTANAERREVCADRVGNIRRRQMRVVLFGHGRIGMA